MPVYDYTYQTWEGERRGPLYRWTAIPKFTLMEFFSKRLFIALFTISWLQFIGRVAYVYLKVNTEFLKFMDVQPGLLPPVDAVFFKTMIDAQIFFCFIFTFMMGSSLISRDLKHSAAVLYMSKPISRWEYFIGKFMPIFGLLMLVTWFQTAFVFVLQALIAPANSYWRLNFWSEYAWMFPAITFYSAIVSITLSLMILASSSLTKNNRYAGSGFAIYLIGSGIVARIMVDIMRDEHYLVISPFRSGMEVGRYLFRDGGYHPLSQPLAWSGILAVWIISGVILKWRLDNAAKYGR